MVHEKFRFGLGLVRVVITSVLIVFGPFSAVLADSGGEEGLSAIEYAQALKAKGIVELRAGKLNEGLQYLEEAKIIYHQLSDALGYAETLLYIGDVHHGKGNYQVSDSVLKNAASLAEDMGADALLVSIKAAMARNYYVTEKYAQASQYLDESLALAREGGYDHLVALVLNDYGNLYALQGELQRAHASYAESAEIAESSGNGMSSAKAHVNSAVVLSADSLTALAVLKPALERAENAARALDDSQVKARLFITVAGLYQDNFNRLGGPVLQERAETVHDMVIDALDMSVQFGDLQGESYALGALGRLYEAAERYHDALDYTRRALFVAQQTQDPAVLFRLFWQSGRLHNTLGDVAEAIKSYRHSIFNLQSIRHSAPHHFVASQALFKRDVRAVYFEFVGLLMAASESTEDVEGVQLLLLEARSALEEYKAAELRNYFQDDCVDAYRERANMLNYTAPGTAVVYPVLFKNTLKFIVSYHDEFRQYDVDVDSARLSEAVNGFRRALEAPRVAGMVRQSLRLYEWLFSPYEEDLIEKGVETVVFVPDGPLRLVPMAALYDGQKYLVERFVFAKSPGLTLTDSQSMDRRDIGVMSVGLTKPVQGFPSLPFVSSELDSIGALYRTRRVQDEAFLVENIDKELAKRSYPVVHIATHGQFASNAKDSFLLTYEGKITMNHLARFIERSRYGGQPIELLTLSACQTAVGDDQAALGLAGLSVRSGARSALATLWFINDEASSILMAEFYKQLKNSDISKAKALQRAQRKLLSSQKYHHPNYWSAFLLIGNWL